jgi:hypothetical protein
VGGFVLDEAVANAISSQALESLMSTKLTPKAIAALQLLKGTSRHNTRSGKALATMLWPDKLRACTTSLRRGGYYRAAGGYYSKLQKKGLVAHWMDDFDSGYYLTAAGATALAAALLSVPEGK